MSKQNYRRDSGLEDFLQNLGECSSKAPCTVFIIIIDNLPMLANAYGYAGADSIIAELCEKIEAKIGVPFRVSDECLLITVPETGLEKNKTTDSALKKLVSQFGMKQEIHISSIIDFAVVENKQATVDIFDRLYSLANNRNNFETEIEQSSRKKSRAEMALANEISDALDNHRLQLAYQPVIEARSGKLHSYECLLRIIDEQGNASSAGSFIHIAEKMGIIENIDLYVMNMVFDKLDADLEINLSFNVSNLSVSSPAWIKLFFERITPQIARRLTVEITETALMLNLSAAAYFIARLQETGCSVALDDFGSGYTSFRQLRSLSLDYVKLDGSIIQDITRNHHNQLLVKSLLEFLKGLKLKTIAEFVDGGNTAKYLIDAGIDFMQGNYFGEAKLGT